MGRARRLRILAVAGIAPLIIAGCSGSGGSSAGGEITVGAVIPLSGGTASVGQNIRRGYELAQQEINQAGGIDGKNLTFEFADHTGDPATGARAARTLVQQKKVVALTGSYESGVTLVVAQTAEQLKTPYLVPYSSATSITESGFKYTFRTRPALPEWAKTMSQFLVWQGDNGGKQISKVGLLDDGTEYGQSAKTAYTNAAKAADLQVVGAQALEQGQTNLSTQLAQLRSAGAQAIYASTYLQSSMGAIRSMDSLGYHVPYMTVGSGIVDPTFFDLGRLAEGVTSSTSWSPSLENNASKAFAAAYEKKYNSVPTDDAAYAYSAAYVLKEAIQNAGKDVTPEKVAASLRSDKFTSPQANIIPSGGTIKFDEHGQAHPSILMAQAQGGQWKTVFPADLASAKYEPIGR